MWDESRRGEAGNISLCALSAFSANIFEEEKEGVSLKDEREEGMPNVGK